MMRSDGKVREYKQEYYESFRNINRKIDWSQNKVIKYEMYTVVFLERFRVEK